MYKVKSPNKDKEEKITKIRRKRYIKKAAEFR